VVGIPVFFDQRRNMAHAVMEGYGLVVDFNNITTESLTWAIQEATESPKYVLMLQLLKLFGCKYDFSNNCQAVTVQATP